MALITRCVQCGGTDDHPKALYLTAQDTDGARYHYDCLPIDLRDASDHIRTGVSLAESGVHGDALRAQLTNGSEN
jgi:hypothetical protein